MTTGDPQAIRADALQPINRIQYGMVATSRNRELIGSLADTGDMDDYWEFRREDDEREAELD